MALEGLRALPPALARLALRELAEDAAGAPRSLSRAEADAVLGLGEAAAAPPRSTSAAACGRWSSTARCASASGRRRRRPSPSRCPLPGVARLGDWEVEAGPAAGRGQRGRGALGEGLVVRTWRDGDRMRPVGLGGGKSLQDLFTDRKVPRELRRSLPVVESGGQIVWVAGVALDERFAAGPGEARCRRSLRP